MKAILRTKEGFERIEEVEERRPVIQIVDMPRLPLSVEYGDGVALPPTIRKREFLLVEEELVLHYKEI